MRRRLALTDQEIFTLAGLAGRPFKALARSPAGTVVATLGDETLEFGRADAPEHPAVARLTVRRGATPDKPLMSNLGNVRALKVVSSAIAPRPAESFFKYKEYQPPYEIGTLLLQRPELAGDEGYEPDLGLVFLAGSYLVIVYVTPLHPGVQLSVPGPMGDGEFAGTTASRPLFGP